MRYSVHTGPNGGVEYRQWTGADTFRTVSKYVAWAHLSDDDKQKASTVAAERKAQKARKSAEDAAWRSIMYR